MSYRNERGEHLRAIVDSTGDTRGAPAVVIPPAWGRTKETLLPLAATLVSTFEAAGKPLVVIRYDERNRKGESHIDPECRTPGSEALKYTFSGAVEDIHTTTKFLATSPEFDSSRILLLTLSLAAIQGRRAAATDPTGRLAGWISLVGMPDLQSSMKAVTGGIDWVYGLARGIRFGPQELVGVLVDMDVAGPDTLTNKLGFFEDARRDMAAIDFPVTWIYGKHDGWMSVDRVRALMSSGESHRRKLLQVPTGHQLRNSREALETFQLVAQEASSILVGRRLRSRVPDLVAMDRRRRAERARRPSTPLDLREFWRSYLLGRDGAVGMELLTATSLYQEFMSQQLRLAEPSPRERVLDLGAGTGDLSVRLAEEAGSSPVTVVAIDLVADALKRGKERLSREDSGRKVELQSLVVDLDSLDRYSLPLRPESFDVALGSLLVSYLLNPEALLTQIWQTLRPGGRVVISAPRRDADSSKAFADTTRERTWLSAKDRFGEQVADKLVDYQAAFLNNAARLLELEDEGRFRFMDEPELAELLRKAGFSKIRTESGFGSPPQFALARGIRA